MDLEDYIALLNQSESDQQLEQQQRNQVGGDVISSSNPRSNSNASSSQQLLVQDQQDHLLFNDLAFWTSADFQTLDDDGLTKDLTAAALHHNAVDLSGLLGMSSLSSFSTDNTLLFGSPSSSSTNVISSPQDSNSLFQQNQLQTASLQPFMLQQYVNALAAAVANSALQQQQPQTSSSLVVQSDSNQSVGIVSPSQLLSSTSHPSASAHAQQGPSAHSNTAALTSISSIDDRRNKNKKAQHWKVAFEANPSTRAPSSIPVLGSNMGSSSLDVFDPFLEHQLPSSSVQTKETNTSKSIRNTRHSNVSCDDNDKEEESTQGSSSPIPEKNRTTESQQTVDHNSKGKRQSRVRSSRNLQNESSSPSSTEANIGKKRKQSKKSATAILMIPPAIAAATGTPTAIPAPLPLCLTTSQDGSNATDENHDESSNAPLYLARVKRTRIADEEEKRRRNTEASARFRAKKKAREQAVAQTAQYLQAKLEASQKKIQEQEMEIKWLRTMLMEKGEGGATRLEVIYEENGLKFQRGTLAASEPALRASSVSSVGE